MTENNSPTPPVEPTPPGYDAPPAQPGQQAPYQPPAYPQQPMQQSYQQPPVQQGYPQGNAPQYQQGGTDPASTVTLNYWLSVFFSWIPALIFFLTEKGKNQFNDEFHKENLNFSIVRGIVGVLTLIPYLGFIFGIASLVLFVLHLVAAIEAPKKYNAGQVYKFPFNLPLVK